MIRVLHIGLSSNPGGIEICVINYFRELVKFGIVFDFVDIYGDGLAFAGEIDKLGGKIYTLKNYKRHPIKAKNDLEKIIVDGQYKCVHINMLSAANILPILACKNARVSPIIHAHNNQTERLIRKVLHSLNVRKLRLSPAIRLACSAEAGIWMFANSEFCVLPNAINVEDFAFNTQFRDKIRTTYNITNDDFVLGFVGRLSYQKNPLFLLDILAETQKLSDKRIKLLVVGGGELESQMKKTTTNRGLTDSVIFAGKQMNVNEWYSAMDCFLLPSRYEGLGIVAIEAQANGLPCCLSDAITQETRQTQNVVYLACTKDAHNWASAIDLFMQRDIDRRGTLANSSFDIRQSATRLKEIYEDMYNGKII